MLLVNEESFASFFYMCISCIYFFCFISLTRIFSTMFNRMDESRYPWFVPDLGGERILFFTIKYIITIKFFFQMFFIFRCSGSKLYALSFSFNNISHTILCQDDNIIYQNFIVTVKNS